jgi:TolB-like protein/DNA-binding winged helix-turn-helix (wHTH) protein/tetratricopeptide (TPR) repeat protein
MDGPPLPDGCYVFERCRLDPIGRILARDGQKAKLQGRLFDVLLYLVQNAGRIVEREELLSAIWPSRTVDEGSVPRSISSLRLAFKAIGVEDTLIHTVAGRGYSFSTRVSFEPADVPQMTQPTMVPQAAGFREGRQLRGKLAAAIGAATALALAAALWRNMAAAPAPPPHSIAVLPFTNVSGDPAQDYLADGLSTELINALGRVDDIRVASGTSSSSFKARHLLVGEIGRLLNVGYVLEGSVSRSGTRLHVTTQLIDTITGFQKWSRDYDGDQAGVLAVEDQIAPAVITAIKGTAQDTDLASLVMGRTTNARAFDAYLVGMAALGEPNGAGNSQAIAAFSRAITLDPAYADAYVARARARVYDVVGDTSFNPSEGEARLDEAVRDAETAVRLAPKLGGAHAALGMALKYRLVEPTRAATEYGQAMALAPDDAETAMSYAYFQLELGHTALAVATAQHAAALDSLRAMNYRTLAVILSYAHRYDDAMAALAHARGLSPAEPGPDRIALGLVLTAKGDAAAARTTCAGGLDYYDLACLALAEHALGHNAAAEAALAKLHILLGDSGAYLYAGIAAAWGQTDPALRWLRRAYELRDPGLADIKIDPRLASLRGTPAFETIVRQMGFPE